MRQYFNGRIDLAKMNAEVVQLFTSESLKLHHQFLKYLSGERIPLEPPTAAQIRKSPSYISVDKKY